MKRINYKSSSIFVTISIIIASLIVFSFGCVKKEEKEVKIGAILSLTGDFAIFGEEIKKGIELAVEEAKSSGLHLTVFYEDDQSLSPVAGVNAANKLITVNKIDVGLTMIVEESRPISSFFGKSKVSLIVLWDSNKFIKEAGEYIFSNGFYFSNNSRVYRSRIICKCMKITLKRTCLAQTQAALPFGEAVA